MRSPIKGDSTQGLNLEVLQLNNMAWLKIITNKTVPKFSPIIILPHFL